MPPNFYTIELQRSYGGGQKRSAHPEKWDKLRALQKTCLLICEFRPDFLESPHLLSRYCLGAVCGLVYVRKVLDYHTCMWHDHWGTPQRWEYSSPVNMFTKMY
jgi:hypothetical protein